MKNKRLGCLTLNGLAAAFITLLFIGGFSIARGGALFSPGDLNAQAGESLGGVSSHNEIEQCAACHTAFWDSDRMTDRCLECHREISAQVEGKAGLHAAMLQEEPYVCQDCHTEHHGPEASLTEIDANTFPHDLTGFSLQGHLQAEDPLECSDCHETLEEFNTTSCASCHQELDNAFLSEHIQMFGENCLNCHDGIDTYGEGFDHNQLTFALVGEHAPLECSTCHVDQSSIEELRLTPQECYACHEDDDAHQGTFGKECEQCHTPEGWDIVSFDHSQLEFALIGKHVDVECQECHQSAVFVSMPHTCFDCHAEDDAHNGELGTDCERCHVPDDWDVITFNHAQTRFPLTGAHISLSCITCHKGGSFSGTPAACSACHAEPSYHSGLFSSSCESCHSTSSWSPANFNLAHGFPINHEGAGGKCGECHPSTLHSYTCYTCHDQGEIDSKHREEGIADYSDCMRCHPTGEEGDDGGGGNGSEDDDDD